MRKRTQRKQIERLEAVRDLITDPDHWITGSMAKTRSWAPTLASASDAYRFCLVGAVTHVASAQAGLLTPVGWTRRRRLLNRLCQTYVQKEGVMGPVGTRVLMIFNDHSTTNERVLKLIDATIERLRPKPEPEPEPVIEPVVEIQSEPQAEEHVERELEPVG